MDVQDGLGGELDLAARSHAIRLADIIVLQPGEEGNQLIARNGCQRRVGGEELPQFL